jgi:tape measure domain-containing protein
MTLGDIVTRFVADVSNFANGLQAMQGQANNFARSVSSASATASSGFAGMGRSIMGAVQNAGQWVFAARNLMEGAVGIAQALFGSTAAMEQTRVAFSNILGPGKATNDMLAQLQTFAAKTPFEFPELAHDAQLLLSMGFAGSSIIPTMTAVGDAVAGVGAGSAGIETVVRVLGQMSAAGRVNAGDMMQLTSLGIPAWKILADAMGITVGQARALSERGLIPANTAVNQLVSGMEKMYGGQMVGQASTMNGLVSTLHDNFNMALMALVGPVFNMARGGLQQLVALTSSPSFTQFATVVGQGIGSALQTVAQMIVPVAAGIGSFVSWLQQGSAPALAVRAALIGLGAAVLTFAIGTAGIVAGFTAWATAAWAAALATIAATWPILAVAAAVGLLVAAFLYFYQTSVPFREAVNSIVAAFQQFWAILSANFLPAMQQIGGFLAGVFVPVWRQLVVVWQTQLMPLFAQLAPAFAQLQPLLQAIGFIIGAVVVVALALLVGALAGVVKGLAGFITGLATVVAGVVQVFTGVVQVIGGVVAFIDDLLHGRFGKLAADLGAIWQGIVNIFVGAWTTIAGIFQTAWGTIAGIVTGFVQGVIGFFQFLSSILVGRSIIPEMIGAIVQFFAGLPGRVLGFIAGLVASAVASFLNLRNAAIAAVVSLVSGVVSSFSGLPGQVLGFFNTVRSNVLGVLSSIAGAAFSAAAGIGRSIVSGLTSMIGTIASAASNVASTIASYLPHSPAEQGPLSRIDEFMPAMTDMLDEGIRAGIPQINAAMNLLVAPTGGATGAGTPSRLGPMIVPVRAGGPTIITLQINGRDLARALGPHLMDEVQLQIGVR